MDDYKKILKSASLRYSILNMLRFIPDKTMLKLQYSIKFKRRLNLKSPERFIEKIQWYKIFYKNDLMPKRSDKYMAEVNKI